MNRKHDVVFINELTLDAIIGIYEHERINKQPISLDIELEWDNRAAGDSDDIGDTLDYEKISNFIKEYVENSAFLLVEALAEKLAEKLIKDFAAPSVMIELHKLQAITHTRSVGVRIYRQLSDY